jgi:hypothetical protein
MSNTKKYTSSKFKKNHPVMTVLPIFGPIAEMASSFNIVKNVVKHLTQNDVKHIKIDFGFSMSENEMNLLSKALNTNTSLITLKLYNCTLTDHLVKILAKSLEDNHTLTELSIGSWQNFHKDKITDESINYFIDTIKINKTLTKITIDEPDTEKFITKYSADFKKMNAILQNNLNQNIKNSSLIYSNSKSTPTLHNAFTRRKSSSNSKKTKRKSSSNSVNLRVPDFEEPNF